MCYNKPCRCSCDMVLVKSNEKYIGEYSPGAFAYGSSEGYKTLWMKLPDNSICVIPIEPTGTDKQNWEWDGNLNKPTLKPSIVHWTVINGKQHEAWHGEIKEGRMESV